MLQPMQQPAPSQPSPSLPSFAGLLATLTSPPPSLPSDADDDAPPWNSSDLGEDVATLSYERALGARARYRLANRDLASDSDRGDGSLTRGSDPGSGARADAAIELDAAGAIGTAGAIDASGAFDAAGAAVAVDAVREWQTGTAPDRDLRSASVTIRLSRAECARLHQRAAEAGLTVSAYLRSCAVEAEALRAQVKQALAELKTAAETARPVARPRRRWLGWIQWLTRRRR
jgi:hypothetical protein